MTGDQGCPKPRLHCDLVGSAYVGHYGDAANEKSAISASGRVNIRVLLGYGWPPGKATFMAGTRPSGSEVKKVIPSIDPHHTRIDHCEMAVHASEQYQFTQALREAKAHRRADRNASHRPSRRRYFRLIPRHISPAPR